MKTNKKVSRIRGTGPKALLKERKSASGIEIYELDPRITEPGRRVYPQELRNFTLEISLFILFRGLSAEFRVDDERSDIFASSRKTRADNLGRSGRFRDPASYPSQRA